MRGIMWHALSNPDDWYGFHLDSYTYPPEHGYQTKNGPMYFILRHGSSEDWDRFVIELGMEAYLDDPRFGNYGRRATGIGQHAADVRPIWEEAFKDRTREELIDLVRSIGGDAVPILDYPCAGCRPAGAGARRDYGDRPSNRRKLQHGGAGRALFANAHRDPDPAADAGPAY